MFTKGSFLKVLHHACSGICSAGAQIHLVFYGAAPLSQIYTGFEVCAICELRIANCFWNWELQLPVKCRYLTVERGVVTQVRLRGEPSGAYLVRHAGDPYLTVEDPVLHNPCSLVPVRITSLRVDPEGPVIISNSLNDVPGSTGEPPSAGGVKGGAPSKAWAA